MTLGFFNPSSNPDAISEKVLAVPKAQECLLPMGVTSENVSKDFGITRKVQDEFAALSFVKAADAQKRGKFRSEIIPITVKFVDPKTKSESEIVVDKDDGIRDGVTPQSLSKLKPSFAEDGCSHAGNSSQVSDGAAAVLLARRSAAKKLGLPILGKFVGASVVGVPPRIMGVGPAYAIPKLLEKHGITKDDVDFYEASTNHGTNGLGTHLFSLDQRGVRFPSPLLHRQDRDPTRKS
jgi:acetyl-CoA acyltransferase 1